METLCLAEEREGQRKPLTQSQATATALAPLLKALARLLGTSPARLIEHVRIHLSESSCSCIHSHREALDGIPSSLGSLSSKQNSIV